LWEKDAFIPLVFTKGEVMDQYDGIPYLRLEGRENRIDKREGKVTTPGKITVIEEDSPPTFIPLNIETPSCRRKREGKKNRDKVSKRGLSIP